MTSPASNPNTIPSATSGSRSKLLSGNFKNFLSKPALKHPQQALTVQLFNAEQKASGDAAPPRIAPAKTSGRETADNTTSGSFQDE
ncbi:hypothetical protein yc1106_07435 [Curvularia clavata]|uniref:Uncharacterized protein n=1 Tax=Curvularia clavata TaxID=95742 RepID=A0A9Q8ZDI1_CURCL|nr:hypothetical protein yc1106_07435 [Curvularia clavata]